MNPNYYQIINWWIYAGKEIELAPDHIVDAPEPISVINSPTNWGDFVIKKPAGVLVTPNDSQLVLALGYPPVYPNSAITKGIEGFAVVGFSVSPAGQVYDAFIIESEPNSIFDRSALKAIKKFKYKAKMENGKAVATDGQRYLFSYKLD